MGIARRELLKFLGGAAAGAAFTPVPWKLLDDVSIWSQNWSWIPRPPRGEIAIRHTTCTVCPAGCGVRARCSGAQPIALAGTAEHPLSRGKLCPVGIGAHQLAFDPRRVRSPRLHGKPATPDAAVEEIRAAIAAARRGGGVVAVMDTRPGRAVSFQYRRFVAGMANGLYIPQPSREGATLEALRRMMGGAPFGIDLDAARIILSFGAPVLDGWGTPGRVMTLRPFFRLIQVETRLSRTASAADEWLPVRPGAEGILALAIAHVLLRRNLCPSSALRTIRDLDRYRGLVAGYAPESATALTGISADTVERVASALATQGPALVLGGGDPAGGPLGQDEEAAVAGLNLLAGACGTTIVERREAPVPSAWRSNPRTARLEDAPDGSIAVLLVDAAGSGDAIAWKAVERKLAPRHTVVALASFPDEFVEHADLVVPAPGWLEAAEDVPTPFDARSESFAVATAMLPAPSSAIEPAVLLERIGAGPWKDAIRARADAIHAGGRGSLFLPAERSTKPVKEIAKADEFWQALAEGAVWVDDPARDDASRPVRLLAGMEPANFAAGTAGKRAAADGRYPLPLVPFGWRGAMGALPPLATKLYQESGLRPAGSLALIHPATAEACGLEDGKAAVVETAAGRVQVAVNFDPAAMPGVLHVAGAPMLEGEPLRTVMDVCEPDVDCSLRGARARVWKA